LPVEIQKEIVEIGRRPSQNQITEKHARALLMLNRSKEKQRELFKLIKDGVLTLTGDEAIEKVKNMKGFEGQRVFKLSYTNEVELIEKLENAIQKLQVKLNKTQGVPRCPYPLKK